MEAGASAGTGGGTTCGRRTAASAADAAAVSAAANRLPALPAAQRQADAPAAAAAAAAVAAADAADAALLLPNPNGSGVFRSDDGGKTWTFMSNQNQRPTYFSQIRVDPVNDQKLFVGGTPGQMSLDGGKTWNGLTGSHTDYHAFWINPNDPAHRVRSATMAASISATTAASPGIITTTSRWASSIRFRPICAVPTCVCGGLQDNNAWCGPSALRSTTGGVNTDWFTVAGGDGFYTRQDPTDWAIVYGESQDGNMSRHDLRAGTQKSIRPNAGPPAAAAAAWRRQRLPTARAAILRRLNRRAGEPNAGAIAQRTDSALTRAAAAAGRRRTRRRRVAADAAARPTSSTRPTSSIRSASTGTRRSRSLRTIRR